MNHIDFSQPNGFPLEADITLGGMQENYVGGIRGLGQAFGDATIVSGLLPNGSSVTSGWICLEKDFVFFEGGAPHVSFYIETAVVSKANENGLVVERYFTKRARFGVHATLPNHSFEKLRRLAPCFLIQMAILAAFQLESEVILAGCAVEANPQTAQFNITEGLILLDGELLESPRVENLAGQWHLMKDSQNVGQANFSLAVIPNMSHSIVFEMGGTTQYYQDILRRNAALVGEIRLLSIRSADFTPNGLGVNRMKGWAICNGANGTTDMSGRVPVGFHANSPKYGVIGNVGGAENVTLSIANMPAHNHQSGTGEVHSGDFGLIRRSRTGESRTINGVDAQGSGNEPDIVSIPQRIPMEGAGQSFEVLSPYKTLLYIQRI